MYDSKTWERNQRAGKPVRRPGHSKPPCKSCPKCRDEETPSPKVGQANTLSRKNGRTLQRYFEHQAGGGTVDSLMRKNFGIIQQLFSFVDQSRKQAVVRNTELLQYLLKI